MAISYVGGAIGTTGGTASTTVAITYAPTAGNTLLVFGSAAANITGVSDNAGNIYVRLAGPLRNIVFGSLWGTAPGTVKAGATIITVTFASSQTISAGVVEYSGVQAYGKVSSANSGFSFNPNSTITTQDDNNVVVVGMAVRGTQTWTADEGNLRQNQPGATSSVPGIGISDNTAATPASVTSGATISAEMSWLSCGIELRSVTPAFGFNHMQSAEAYQATSSTCSVTLPQAPALGSLVAVAVVAYTGSTGITLGSVRDSNGNSYTISPNSPASVNESTVGGVWLAYLLSAPANASATITATFSATNAQSAIYADEFAIINGTAEFDKDVAGNGSGSDVSVPSLTPTNANSLLYAASAVSASVWGVSVSGSVWTLGAIDNDLSSCNEYYIGSPASSVSVDVALSGSGTWDSIAMAFYIKAFSPLSCSIEGTATVSAFLPFQANVIQQTMLRICYQALAQGITVTPTTVVSTAYTWGMVKPRGVFPPRYPGIPSDIGSCWEYWDELLASGLIPPGAVRN